MEDAAAYALSLPVDEHLLEPLGRVAWAAIRLHHGIRDALNHINGAPSDRPFDLTLGPAVTKLRNSANRLVPADRDALHDWATRHADPAVEARNGVLHAITYTADDGRQALR